MHRKPAPHGIGIGIGAGADKIFRPAS